MSDPTPTPPIPPGEVTRLLQAWSDGDEHARDRLIPLVFDELRQIARRQYSLERADHTLRPTALVNELYMRFVEQRTVQWRNRREFFAVAARLIRRILVDHARRHRAARRGGGGPKILFDEALGLPIMEEPRLLELDDALKDLESKDPRGSRVVELHAFGGLSFDEIAEVLEVSRITTLRDWKHAKLWLRRQLSQTDH